MLVIIDHYSDCQTFFHTIALCYLWYFARRYTMSIVANYQKVCPGINLNIDAMSASIQCYTRSFNNRIWNANKRLDS
jgi:hypothetical protein